MKQTIAAIYILGILIIGFLVHFALAERAYVRQLAANQLVTVTAINGIYSETKDLVNFDIIEMPTQVNDYVSKNKK